MVIARLRELSRNADYAALCAAAEQVATDAAASPVDRAVAAVLWGYSLLRLDVHRHFGQAMDIASEGAAALAQVTSDDADWALLIFGMCHQVAGDYDAAEQAFRRVLARPISPLYRAICAGNLANTLSEQGLLAEAAEVFLNAGRDLDALPADQVTPTTARERQRIRLNLVDCLLNQDNLSGAEAELSRVDPNHLTPLLHVLHLLCQARIAMFQDRWEEAAQLGHRAHFEALQVGYIPFREAALGVLVAVSGRRGRLSEQRRLVQEMASLMASKGG